MRAVVQGSKVLPGGSHIEVVIQQYGDRVLVLVTQLGKVGNLARRFPSFAKKDIFR
jgi:hypothetical protein